MKTSAVVSRVAWFPSLFTLSAAAAVSLFMAACDGGGGGGGGGSGGSSTLIGNVESFEGGSSFYLPRERETWYARLTGLLVPAAEAAVKGVGVSCAGQSGTTADDGLFVISGVPAGTQVIEFNYGGQTASMSVDVPANATVNLKNVRVRNGSAESDGVDVEIHPDSEESEDGVSGDGVSADGDSVDGDSADSVSEDGESDDGVSDETSDDLSEDDSVDEDSGENSEEGESGEEDGESLDE